jgi:hypothetical protein
METCKKCHELVDEVLASKTGRACKKCVSEYNRAYRAANKDRISAQKKAWKLKNAEHVKAKDIAYASANQDKKAAARKRWKEKNRALDRESKAKYRKANKGKVQAWGVKRRVAQLNRTPSWLTSDDLWMMSQAYELAALRTNMFGFSWHVDHILPLQGKVVSGLHVPLNLQVIPWVDNVRKGNRI